ncbi:MAG TPA: branched-chain amino acid transaminase [Longimicrobiales bacterium]|nr:branched-chain amino acid transaminase [Longimicrobiales bacterium]
MASGFEKTDWVWRDGKLVRWDDANIHVLSHAVHYGSSVFEGIRFYQTPDGPAVFRLPEHMRRLADSAKIYRMELRWGEKALGDACCEVVRRNGLNEGYLRPIALRGYGAPGLNPLPCPVEIFILCWPWGAYLGDEGMQKGVDACVSSWHRMEPNTFPAGAKAGGTYLSSQLMRMEALANGYAEAIALGPGGLLSEGSGQNIFVVRNGVLMTPPIDGTLLAGITRDSVLTIARDIGIPTSEQPLPRETLYTCDEAFFTGTAAEVTPIRSVDRIPVGSGVVGPITRTVQQRLLGIARGQIPDPYGWLTPVRNVPAGVA